MTALKGRDIENFVTRRTENIPVALIYGPDQGLVRERAQKLSHQVVEDLNDPFNAIELTDTDLSEIGKLADEAAALSFMGGERLIRLRRGGDAVGKAVLFLLDGIKEGRVKPNALVVIEAGDLKKSHALRKACEASKHAVTLPCYTDNQKDVVTVIKDGLAAEGITATDDALLALADRLGDDRGLTRTELEKLILYVGPQSTRKGAAKATIDDVRACLADSTADATFDIVDLALSGQPSKLSEALHRAEAAGVSAMAAIRIAQGKLLRLLTVQNHIREGDAPSAAMKKLRPPIFFAEQRRFEDQLRRWPAPALEAGLKELFETDLDAKRTGMPQREVVERTLLRLAVGAARR